MSAAQKTYTRFSFAQRIEHILLILSFTILGLTGLPQKFPLSPISQTVVTGLGGIETIRIIHRVAATVFLLEAIYHLVVVGYGLYVRRSRATMLPSIKDAQDAIQAFMYNLGLNKQPPKMDRYNFVEKAEYWAMAWGLIVMAVTGFMLWNPIATTRILPGQFIPAAKLAHGGEAVLAVLAIILWHFYSVHIKRFNKSMFTGQMDREAMEEEHALELEQIESGKIPPSPPPAVLKQRRTIFVPVAAVASVIMLGAVYWFVSFEESAITTVPPIEQAQVFVPQTPTPTSIPEPTATPAPTQEGQSGGTAGVAWIGDIEDLFKEKCTSCHGSLGNFSAETYADVIKGIEPGNTEGSVVYEVQAAGGHPGQFSDAELARIKEWIDAGAPEQGGAGSPAGAGDTGGDAAAALTWSGGMEDILGKKCGLCHGKAGDYSVKTYENALKAITPGDPDASKLVEIQQRAHPGKFNETELQQVIDWIKAGAPE